MGIALCLISFLVALMGLATEYSTSSYLVRYFAVLREVEEKLNQAGLADPHTGVVTQNGLLRSVDVATNGKTLEDDTGQFDQRFHKRLPVHRAHKVFYGSLLAIWAAVGLVWSVVNLVSL